MVVMGHVIGPYGIQGWIKVSPYTEHIDGLLEFSSWWLSRAGDSWQQVHVVSGRVSGNVLNVKLEEYADRTQAQELKGMQIAIPRDQLPSLPDDGNDGYYWSDLIGIEAINLKGEVLGKVIGLIETGANDVLRIQPAGDDENEILVPFIAQVIAEVDLKHSRIVIDWEADY